jgi:hypothetical protein
MSPYSKYPFSDYGKYARSAARQSPAKRAAARPVTGRDDVHRRRSAPGCGIQADEITVLMLFGVWSECPIRRPHRCQRWRRTRHGSQSRRALDPVCCLRPRWRRLIAEEAMRCRMRSYEGDKVIISNALASNLFLNATEVEATRRDSGPVSLNVRNGERRHRLRSAASFIVFRNFLFQKVVYLGAVQPPQAQGQDQSATRPLFASTYGLQGFGGSAGLW